MRRTTVTLLGTAALIALAAAPSLAQKGPAADPFPLAYELCQEAIATGPLTAAADALTARGWTIDGAEAPGPSTHTLRASFAGSPFGDATFRVEATDIEPVFRMSCALDIDDFVGTADLADIAGASMPGEVRPFPYGGDYGTWSIQLDDGFTLFSIVNIPGYFHFDMVWIEWGGPRG